MLSRRQFFKLSAAAGVGAAMASTWKFSPLGLQRVFAQAIEGGSLLPSSVPKFVTPLVKPPAMPSGGRTRARGGKNPDYYTIAMRQFDQQILPALDGSGNPTNLGMTTVWSYGPSGDPRTVAEGGSYFYPAFTIEAKWNRPVRVKWINDLTDASGNFLPHLLPVDQTLHWANPPGGTAGRDMRPTFAETPGSYTGPVPMVTHLHGAVDVGDESDGYAEAWYLPRTADIPDGYATEGTWYNTFAAKFQTKFGEAWEPGTATFQYLNTQRAATLWYHDHTLGMTRVNVYAGPAGFYLIRGGPDDVGGGKLPGPAPVLGSDPFGTYYEIPIAIQDRSFDDDGSLFYPDSRAFFDGIPGPYIPDSDISPIWNPEFFGNMMVVNGQTWPYLEVEQRRYRFRLLNGCNSRFLILDFGDIPNAEVWQIGAEGGFLPAPVRLNDFRYPEATPGTGATILMAPAERADIIVDFTNVPQGDYILKNLGPDEPFGGGVIGTAFAPSDPSSTGLVMQFRVGPALSVDRTTPPVSLNLPTYSPPAGGTTRQVALLEQMSQTFEGPSEALLGVLEGGVAVKKFWHDPITENPQVGDVEVWEIYNFTADAHPIHIHEVTFQVVDRQALDTDPTGDVIQPVNPIGAPRAPEAWESGPKDTVIAYPGEVTRVRAQFNTAGLFVWHCHIVEHEDNEMMRPYAIGTVPTPTMP